MSKYNSNKIIFSDLDSTLLNSDGFFSKYTKEIVAKVYEEGMFLIPLTARSTSDVMRQAKRLKLDKFGGIIGANNGSQLYDFKNNVWILNEKIDRKIIEHVFKDTYKKYKAKVHFFSDDSTYVYKRGGNSLYWAQMMASDYVIVDKIEDIEDEINHLTIVLNKDVSDEESIDFYENVLMKYTKMGVDVHKYTDRVFEVSPKGVNKGHAVEAALDYLEIDKKKVHTYAFGDSHNDFSMFDKVDTGIAVDNADTGLKDAADDLTLSNDQDGVAKYISANILIK